MHNEQLKLTPVKRLFRMLSLDKREIFVVYAYAIFNGLINLSLPLGIQAIIGLVISAQYSASLGLLIFIVVVGIAASGSIQILQVSLTENLQRRIFTRASFEFAYRIPRFRTEALRGIYPPELVNRFFDTLQIQKGLSKLLIDISTSTLQVLFGLALLALYHPFFVFFAIFLLALLIIIFVYTGPRGLHTSIYESKYKYQVAYWLEELARVMGSFKLAGPTDLPVKKTNYFVGEYLKYRKQHFRILIFQFGNIVVFKTLITGGLLVLGSLLVINQEINLGQFVASEIIILLVLNSVEKLILSMETVYDVLTGLEKLGQVTDLEIERSEGVPLPTGDKKGIGVELNNLTFRYPGEDREALSEVSLDIKPGSKVAIVGTNGSGKSTLTAVLAGQYTQFVGSMNINGIPAGSINPDSLRVSVGDNLRLQALFNGTLEENVHLGRPNIDTSATIDALIKVGLEDFLNHLPDGLETEILPEGAGYPSSIRQRILLARTLVANPALIVMDHALNDIDYIERKQLIAMLTDAQAPWTLVASGNDALLMEHCSTIVTLDKGRVVDVKDNSHA